MRCWGRLAEPAASGYDNLKPSGVIEFWLRGFELGFILIFMSVPSHPDLPSLQALREDVIALGHEAAELARERLLRPARDLAHDSQRQVEAAGERVADEVEQAGDLLRAERDLAAGWIQKNPWAAVGLAFGAGVILSELCRGRR
jgi:ElaB/YqjD/DUF883 family membrane-anchored ribosome-binding protein